MKEIKKFRKIATQYKKEFKDIISGYNIVDVDKEKLMLKNENGEIFIVSYNNNVISFRNPKQNILRDIKLILPSGKNKDTKIVETQIEKRKNGIIVEYITKKYQYLTPFAEQKQISNLISQRFVIKNKNYSVNYLTDLSNIEEIKKQSSIAIQYISKILSYDTSKHNLKLYVTEKSEYTEYIIGLYDKIDGDNMLSRIYDLYNGNFSEDNFYDILKINSNILSPDCFDYKTKYGLTSKENDIVGKSELIKPLEQLRLINKLVVEFTGYDKLVDVYNRESLIGAITFKLNPIETAKKVVEDVLNINYQDFILLSHTEQKKLLQSKKTGKQYKLLKKL